MADDPYGWATGKLCQVTRPPMRACQWSEDENWEWTSYNLSIIFNSNIILLSKQKL